MAHALRIPAPPPQEEDNPLWLIVLCDLMTNLMLFFLVCYSFTLRGEADRAKLQAALRGEVHAELKDSQIEEQAMKEPAVLELVKRFEEAGLAREAQIDASESRLRVRLAAPVLFRSGSAQLSGRALKALEALGPALSAYPNDVIVEGHTDSVPPGRAWASNRVLSLERALAVMGFLRERFEVPEARLVAAGYGDTRPVADNATRTGRAANRRIEIVLLRRSSPAALGKTGTDAPPAQGVLPP